MEIGILASTWGLPPWPGLGGLLESSTWGLPPWPGVYPPLLWVYPFDWAKPRVYPPDHTGFTLQMGSPHVSKQRGKPSNKFNNEFDHFLAGVKIGILASTWGLPPWPGLGRLLESSTWGLPPLAGGLPSLALGLPF